MADIAKHCLAATSCMSQWPWSTKHKTANISGLNQASCQLQPTQLAGTCSRQEEAVGAYERIDKMNQWTEGVSQWMHLLCRPSVVDCIQYMQGKACDVKR